MGVSKKLYEQQQLKDKAREEQSQVSKKEFEIAKSFYGSYFESLKHLIDERGWLRMCIETPIEFVKFSRSNRNWFESRVVNTKEAFNVFIRPTCNLS